MDIKDKTDFQGPVSLDAIFAATKSTKSEDTSKDKKSTVPPTEEILKKDPVEKLDSVEKKEKEEDTKTKEDSEETNTSIEQPSSKPQNKEQEGTDSFKTAKNLISLGLLEDFSIQTSDEDENGTPISEFKTMSEDNLKEIINIHKQEKDKEISSKYLPKGNLKDHQLKVFEILSNGGDLSQIAETPEKALERPFEGFNMDDQERQVDVRYTDLVHSKGLDHESAITIIDKEVKSGKIKEKALETFDLYRSAHENYVNDILEKTKKEKEFKDLNFKENKKTLVAKLKESGFKESVYKKVASEYAKKNDKGDYALVDKLRQALEAPEENHELILHLTDKKLFNETFKIKSSQEAQKTIVRLASKASSKGNKKSAKPSTSEAAAPWLQYAKVHNETIKN